MVSRPRPRNVAAARGWLVVSAWAPELARLDAALPLLPARVRPTLVPGGVGVGLVEAAAGTARLIAEHRPQALLLVGTAGVYPGHGPAFPLGSAVVVDQMVLLPGASGGAVGFLPDLVPIRARSSSTLARAVRQAARLPAADVACPLAITVGARAAATAARSSGCALENLEAFAVARAAARAGIPFAAVLGVANHVGPAGHREWRRHARRAAAAACDAVLGFFASLAKPLRAQRERRAQSTG
jgi:futalosine hydrolase